MGVKSMVCGLLVGLTVFVPVGLMAPRIPAVAKAVDFQLRNNATYLKSVSETLTLCGKTAKQETLEGCFASVQKGFEFRMVHLKSGEAEVTELYHEAAALPLYEVDQKLDQYREVVERGVRLWLWRRGMMEAKLAADTITRDWGPGVSL